jgi:hypothetical protein
MDAAPRHNPRWSNEVQNPLEIAGFFLAIYLDGLKAGAMVIPFTFRPEKACSRPRSAADR